MKNIKIVLGVSLVSFCLMSCDKKTESPISHQNSPKTEDASNLQTSPKEGKDQEKPLSMDMIALNSLGLQPLEIDPTALPPLPTPADPSDNIGLDSIYKKWKEVSPKEDAPEIGVYFITSQYIIWGYGKPKGILLGKRTHVSERTTDTEKEFRKWHNKPYLPLTLNCGDGSDYLEESSRLNNKISAHRFDSLTRLHGVVKGNWAFHEHTPVPYDLRHMRIAYNGVDISSLFSIRYQDYKDVIRTGQYNKWYWRDVRVSDVGMDVLDWIFDSYFKLYPLTKDYPKFTVIFILKDGTVISREVEHQV